MEQFESFDLGDESDDGDVAPPNNNADYCSSPTLPSNQDGISSILAAGRLSLLECAIQKFADEDTHVSNSKFNKFFVIKVCVQLEFSCLNRFFYHLSVFTNLMNVSPFYKPNGFCGGPWVY